MPQTHYPRNIARPTGEPALDQAFTTALRERRDKHPQQNVAGAKALSNASAGSSQIEETKEALRRYRPGGRRVSDDHLVQVCTMIANCLQQSDLCINFNAFDFFSMPVECEFFATDRISAALNYGKRLHGPRPSYGMSFFVLRDEVKRNARFSIRDAFLRSHHAAARERVSYDTLGSIYGIAARHNEALRRTLDEVCFYFATLPDTIPPGTDYTLIEALPSEPGLLAGGISEIHLSPLHPRTAARTKGEPALSGQVWADIQQNAQFFADRYGGKLIVMNDEVAAKS